MSFRHRALQLLLPLLLPLLLVFSQQQAVLHLLGHDLSQLSAADVAADVAADAAARGPAKDPADPQELVCAKCLAVAHFAHVVVGDIPRIEAVRATARTDRRRGACLARPAVLLPIPEPRPADRLLIPRVVRP